MLLISAAQADGLRSRMLDGKADAFMNNLLMDFPAELTGRQLSELKREVRGLTRQFFDLGFRDGQHLYRLVAWGMFLGHDFLETHCNGRPFDIAGEIASEADRFRRIRTMLVADARPLSDEDEAIRAL